MSNPKFCCVSMAAWGLALATSAASAQAIRSKTFESVSPNGKVSILSRCDGERRQCEVTARSGSHVVEIGPRAYPAGPGIRWVNLDTAAVEFKCGEGCRTTWFYNPRTGASAGYRGVLAVDGVRMRAAIANEQRQEIQVLPIVAGEGAVATCRIRRDWSPAGALAIGGKIVSLVFRSNGDLKLQFRRSTNAEAVAETIALDKAGAC